MTPTDLMIIQVALKYYAKNHPEKRKRVYKLIRQLQTGTMEIVEK